MHHVLKFRKGLESQRKPKNKEKFGHDFLSYSPCLLHLSGRTQSGPCLPPSAKISNTAALPVGSLFHTTAAFSALIPFTSYSSHSWRKRKCLQKNPYYFIGKTNFEGKKERRNETKVKSSSNFLLTNYVTSYKSILISFR